jgi:DNA-binding transcriptional regulator GbsR (MarR family)
MNSPKETVSRMNTPETPEERIKQEYIRDFGDAYLRFGLPRLMGHVVGVLLFEEGPLSLDEITDQLGVSKGPVSQIMSRLRDHNLVIRDNIPGNRKDYYRAADDIFGQAFINHMGLFRRNLELARRYHERVHENRDDIPEYFHGRVREMTEFYELMIKHLQEFVANWQSSRIGSTDQRRA